MAALRSLALCVLGASALGAGCKDVARWSSSDAVAAEMPTLRAAADAGVSAGALSPPYPVVSAPASPKLNACVAAYQAAKLIEDFAKIADDTDCPLADLALSKWVRLATRETASDELRRRRGTLLSKDDSESLAARVALDRLLGDIDALKKDLLAAFERGAVDRVETVRELSALPAAWRPSKEELQRLANRAWLGAPKRARIAKLPAFASKESGTWSDLARAWYSADEPKEAEAAWSKARSLARKDASARCSIELSRAAAYGHRKAAGVDAWTAADKACAKSDETPRIRFNLARATASVGKSKEAQAAFLDLAKASPSHRLADDAIMKAASLARDAEGEDAYRALLTRVADGPKEADMRDDALALLYVSHARSGAWDKALEAAMKLSTTGGPEGVWAGGRTLYLRARALEAQGRTEEAWGGYASILRSYPGAFYMRLAATRANMLRPNETQELWKRKRAEDAAPTANTWSIPSFAATPCFARADVFARVGELRRASDAAKPCAASDKGPNATLGLGVWYVGIGAFDKARALARAGFLDTAHVPEGNWQLAWSIAFPRAHEQLVRDGSAAAQISPALAWGIMREESSFIVDVVSPTGALGLMQLMPNTAVEVARGTAWPTDAASLKTAPANIALGTKLLGHLSKKYAGHEVLIAGAYNAGEGAVDRWLAKRAVSDLDLWVEEIPYDETFGYVRRVTSSASVYRATHLGQRDLDAFVFAGPKASP